MHPLALAAAVRPGSRSSPRATHCTVAERRVERDAGACAGAPTASATATTTGSGPPSGAGASPRGRGDRVVGVERLGEQRAGLRASRPR